jgi:hypothetical protein
VAFDIAAVAMIAAAKAMLAIFCMATSPLCAGSAMRLLAQIRRAGRSAF